MPFRLVRFDADAAGRAPFSRCSRSRAVFASRAARSTSINSRAESDVRSRLSCFSLSVKVCLSRIVVLDLTERRSVAAPNDRRPHRVPSGRQKKPAAHFGTAGSQSFTRHEEWDGVVVPGSAPLPGQPPRLPLCVWSCLRCDSCRSACLQVRHRPHRACGRLLCPSPLAIDTGNPSASTEHDTEALGS